MNNRIRLEQSLFNAIFIPAIPIAAYAIAYEYERGICENFGIPLGFMTINFTSLFLIGTTLIGFCVALVLLSDFISSILPPINTSLQKSLYLTLMILFLFFIFVSESLSSGPKFIGRPKAFYIMVISFIAFEIIFAWVGFLRGRIKKTGKQIENNESKKENEHGELITRPSFVIMNKLGQKWLLILFVIFILMSSAYDLGKLDAKGQSNFLVIDAPQPAIVLRIYGDRLICIEGPFTTEKEKIDFTILNLANLPKLSMRWEAVGPLKVEKGIITLKNLPKKLPGKELKKDSHKQMNL